MLENDCKQTCVSFRNLIVGTVSQGLRRNLEYLLISKGDFKLSEQLTFLAKCLRIIKMPNTTK